MAPPMSQYLVLAVASLSGGLVRGISGFGSAILHTLVWIVCTSAGFDSGSLQQAVVVEALNFVPVAVPLLFLTRAWETGDWRLTVSAWGMSAAFSPIGAAMLVAMDPRTVELIMGCTLVVLIAMRLELHTQAWAWLQRRRGYAPTCAGDVESVVLLGPCAVRSSSGDGGACSCSTLAAPAAASAAALLGTGADGGGPKLTERARRDDSALAVDGEEGRCLLEHSFSEVHTAGGAGKGGAATTAAHRPGPTTVALQAAAVACRPVRKAHCDGGPAVDCGDSLRCDSAWCSREPLPPLAAEAEAVAEVEPPAEAETEAGEEHVPLLSAHSVAERVQAAGLAGVSGAETVQHGRAGALHGEGSTSCRAEGAAAQRGVRAGEGEASVQSQQGLRNGAELCVCDGGALAPMHQEQQPLLCEGPHCSRGLCRQGGLRACREPSQGSCRSSSSVDGAAAAAHAAAAAQKQSWVGAGAWDPGQRQHCVGFCGAEGEPDGLNLAAQAAGVDGAAGWQLCQQQERGGMHDQGAAGGRGHGRCRCSGDGWGGPGEERREWGLRGGTEAGNLRSDPGSAAVAGEGLQLAVRGGGEAWREGRSDAGAAAFLGHSAADQRLGDTAATAAALAEAVAAPAGACAASSSPIPASLPSADATATAAAGSQPPTQHPPSCPLHHPSNPVAHKGLEVTTPTVDPASPADDDPPPSVAPAKPWRERLRSALCTLRSLGTAEGRQRFLRDPSTRRGLVLLWWGSLAGAVAGVMAGLTGMGGPPIMLLYHGLNIDKAVVRGTNAWGGLFQLRLVAYFYMGVIHREDWSLYVICALVHTAAVVLGDRFARYLNQRMFNHVLIALMGICVVLLFCAAFGIDGSSSSSSEAGMS